MKHAPLAIGAHEDHGLGLAGAAALLAGERRGEDPPLDEACGTIDYMAPESLDGAYGDKVDVWAVGVMLHILLSGKHPFRGPSRAATEARSVTRTLAAAPLPC